MSSLHMFAKKNMFYNQTNSLDKFLKIFYHIFGIFNSFSNTCTSETIYCHFLVFFKSVVQVDNPPRK